MRKELITRLGLGTVQFGIDYGVSNTRGKLPDSEVFDILNYAYQAGVGLLDTSAAYGNSEEIIGRFQKENNKFFNVVTKLVLKDREGRINVSDLCKSAVVKLNRDGIYGCLIHKFKDYSDHPEILDTLSGLKEKGFIKKIGFSLYYAEELEYLLDKEIPFDIVQVPYSVFDRRFESYFERLKQKEKEIHVRSVFLQGLAFLDPGNLRGSLKDAEGSVGTLRGLCDENNIPVHALCLDFAMLNNFIDKVIVGVDCKEALEKDISGIDFIGKVKELSDSIDRCQISNEDVLVPYKWKF